MKWAWLLAARLAAQSLAAQLYAQLDARADLADGSPEDLDLSTLSDEEINETLAAWREEDERLEDAEERRAQGSDYEEPWPREVDARVGGWVFPEGSNLWLNTDDTSGPTDPGNDTVRVFPNVFYTGFNFTLPRISDDPNKYYFLGESHPKPTVRVMDSRADRTKCESQNYLPPLGLLYNETTSLFDREVDLILELQHGDGSQDDQVLYDYGSRYAEPNSTFEFMIMHGGDYKLCYAAGGYYDETDGTFAVILPMLLRVPGIQSDCITHGCMKYLRWECWFGFADKGADCVYQPSGVFGGRMGWNVYPGDVSRVWWSSVYPAETDNDYDGVRDLALEENPVLVSCGTSPDTENMLAPMIDSSGGTSLAGVDLSRENAYRAVMPGIAKTANRGFTVSVCYCPDYNRERSINTGSECDEAAEFIQPTGLLHVWHLRICDVGDTGTCTTKYARVLPQQPFALRLDCPPAGACRTTPTDGDGNPQDIENAQGIMIPFTQSAQLRFIEYSELNDKPSWDSEHGCVGAMNDRVARWPSRNIPGGLRTDYKDWGGPYDGDASMSITSAPHLRLSTGMRIDVCYCDFDCSSNETFFKIGEVRTVTAFALAARSNASAAGAVMTLETINRPASFTLFGGISEVTELDEDTQSREISPWNQPHFSRGAHIFFVSYDREEIYLRKGVNTTLEKAKGFHEGHPPHYDQIMDDVCRNEIPGRDLFVNPAGDPSMPNLNTMASYDAYEAVIDCPEGTDPCIKSERLPFNGKDHGARFRSRRAGTIVACYCGEWRNNFLDPDSSGCAVDGGVPQWFYAGRVTVRGPVGGQTWLFPTMTDIEIPMFGWGFTGQDTIRFVPMEEQCADLTDEDGKDPGGIATDVLKVDCPSMYGQGCSFSSNTTSVQLYVEDYTSSDMYVSKIQIEPSGQAFTLEFTKDMRSLLDDGDVLSLDLGMIQIDGVSQNSWTPQQQYVAYELAGERVFQDSISTTRKTYLTGTRMGYLPGPDGGDHPTMVIAPGKFTPKGLDASLNPIYPEVSLIENKGRWTRRNKAKTREEIKAIAPVELRVCWGTPRADGQVRYYAEAGLASFVNPQKMPLAGLSITSTTEQSTTQVMMTMVPGDHPMYVNMDGDLELRLVFNDLSKLEPLKTGDTGPVDGPQEPGFTIPEIIPEKDRVDRDSGNQAFCGMLFSELWSNDDDGFPAPSRCHFTEKRRDTGLDTLYFREYFITFSPKAGLKNRCVVNGQVNQACQYVFVMNARVSIFEKDELLTTMFTQCVGCPVPYTVLERGDGRAAMGTTRAPGAENPQIKSVELRKLDDNGQKDLTKQNIVQLEFTSYELMRRIRGGSVIRIYLYPLTSWSVRDGTCSAILIGMNPNDPSAKLSCGASSLLPINDMVENMTATVQAQSQTGFFADTSSIAERNSVLTIPLRDSITGAPLADNYEITASNRPQLQVAGINLPEEAWFPSRILVSVEDAEGRPHFSTAHGFLFKSTAHEKLLMPRLVSDGPVKAGKFPFRSPKDDDRPDDNAAIARIRIGATVRQDPKTMKSMMTVQLPAGYVCKVVDNDSEPDKDASLFMVDANEDHYPDFARGFIGKSRNAGVWEFTNSRNCVFRMKEYMTLYAGMVFYIRMRILNPAAVVVKSDPDNSWVLKFESSGYDTVSAKRDHLFISLQQEGTFPELFQANLPVIARMDSVMLRATDMTRNSLQNLLVWFHPSTDATAQSEPIDWFVVLDAPYGFDFQNPCKVRPLIDDYYSFTNLDVSSTTKFMGLRACEGSRWKTSVYEPRRRRGSTPALFDGGDDVFTRARFGIKGKLFRNNLYGFSIQVRNPPIHWKGFGYEWTLYLEDTDGYALDGQFGDVELEMQPRSEWLFSCRRRGPPVDDEDEYFNYLMAKYGGFACKKATLKCDQYWQDCREMGSNDWDFAFGIYEHDDYMDPPAINERLEIFPYSRLLMEDMRPYSMTRSSTEIIIAPFRVNANSDTSLRITAPFGYEWTDLSESAYFQAGGFNVLDFNLDTFMVENFGVSERKSYQLVIGRVVLYAGKTYGIKTRVRVPDRIPTSTANRFYVEIGYRENILRFRHMAFSLQAPDVRAIRNAEVRYLSNLAAYSSNVIRIHFQLVTDLVKGDALLIVSDMPNLCLDENDNPKPGCQAMYIKYDVTTQTKPFTGNCLPFDTLEGSAPFPSDLLCWAMYNDGTPRIELHPDKQGLPAGLYMFEVEAQNPSETFSRSTLWDFAAVSEVARSASLIDLNLTTDSAANLPIMAHATFYPLPKVQRKPTGRDDRPMRYNNVIIEFAFSNQPYYVNDFIVRAPEGFYFDEDCLSGIVTHPDEIMGPGEIWPDPMQTTYTKWPELAEVYECLGGSNAARIRFHVTNDFVQNYKFMMRIQVTNPTKTPIHNWWTLEYNGEASTPFRGFIIWAFKDSEMRVGGMQAQDTPNGSPVRIEFRPTQTIPAAVAPGYYDEGFDSGRRLDRRAGGRQDRRLQSPKAEGPGGQLHITIPPGFSIVPRPPSIYTGLVGCPAIITEVIAESVFIEEDFTCVQNNSRSILIEFTTERTLVEGILYAISLRVQNPSHIVEPMYYHMQSYEKDMTAMDEVYIPSLPTVPPLTHWRVANNANQFKGNVKLKVHFTLRLPDPLVAGDDVEMIAPLGFAIRSAGTEDTCRGFEYMEDLIKDPNDPDCTEMGTGDNFCTMLPDYNKTAFPYDLVEKTRYGYPECTCDYLIQLDGEGVLQCRMKMMIRKKRSDLTNRKMFHPKGRQIGWIIETKNPKKQADEIDWSWIITHKYEGDEYEGTVQRSAGAQDCWTSQSQLAQPVIQLLGPTFRQASVASILVGFVPVRDANSLLVIAKAPSGFDFTRATVERPLELPDEVFESRKFVVNNCGITRKVLWNVTIGNIRLGRLGGQTSMTLQTWADGRMRDLIDEVVDFRKGFRLPGEIITESRLLNSKYTESFHDYPLAAMYPAQIEVMSRARLVIVFTQEVKAQERLFIECFGEEPYAILDMMVKVTQDDRMVELERRRLGNSLMQAILDPSKPRKEVALVPQEPAELDFWVIPTGGQNLWKFSTFDNKDLPTNTNDGIETGFSPVQQIAIRIETEKSPPKATIPTRLYFDTVPVGDIRQIEIVAPIGFRFPILCGDMCFPGPRKYPDTDQERPSAILRQSAGANIGDRVSISGAMSPGAEIPFDLFVETPEFNRSTEWAVAVKGPGENILAWGMAPGFGVLQMPYSSVRYGGIYGLQGVLTCVTFEVREINAGLVTQIIVRGPEASDGSPEIEMRCSTKNSVKPMSIGHKASEIECADENPLTLLPIRPLPVGRHAFMVLAQMPHRQPENNVWTIQLKNLEDGAVVDAAFNIPGQKYRKAPIKNPYFDWYSSLSGKQEAKEKHHVTVTIGIELSEDYTEQSNYSMKAVLITFPTNFTQDIPRAYEVENMNKNFPAARGEKWVKLDNPRQLKILLDEFSPWLKADMYMWRFEAVVPPVEFFPHWSENLWQITICEHDLCDSPNDQHTLVSFVKEGFDLRKSAGGQVARSADQFLLFTVGVLMWAWK
jgi:hypothetical protein